jgi:uncharacterized protein (DUF983 family)
MASEATKRIYVPLPLSCVHVTRRGMPPVRSDRPRKSSPYDLDSHPSHVSTTRRLPAAAKAPTFQANRRKGARGRTTGRHEDSVAAAAEKNWLYFSSYTDTSMWDFRCPNCDGDAFFDDILQDARICTSCGMVGDHIHYCYDLSGYAVSRVALVYGTRSEYRRVYHFSERLAQWLRIGPRVPVWLVDGVDALLGDRKGEESLAEYLDCAVLKGLCRSVGLFAVKYSERWIDLRAELLERRGVSSPMVYPSNNELDILRRRFGEASVVFDQRFYTHGNRRTAKDNHFNSNHDLARHNFVNYNYCMHQLLWQLGLQQKCNAHFFFPLLRTKKVLIDLQFMWEVICKETGWPCADLATLTNASSLDRTSPKPIYQAQRAELSRPPSLLSQVSLAPLFSA